MQFIDAGNAVKGVQYKIYFLPFAVEDPDLIQAPDVAKISKDDSIFSDLTNPVNVGTGNLRELVLTATEMNADKIVIYVAKTGTAQDWFATYMIYTKPAGNSLTSPTSGGGLTAAEVWESPNRTLTFSEEDTGVSNFKENFLNLLVLGLQADFDLVDTALNESGFNYYGLRFTNSRYLVVKENMIGGELTYAFPNNNGGKNYPNAWGSRSILTYDASQTLI